MGTVRPGPSGAAAKRPENSGPPVTESFSARPLILVVDDEPVVLAYIANSFRDGGYDFLLAEDGERGLALFVTNPGKIALVLSDVSMPRSSGPQMVREIRKSDENARVLFMTGFDPEQILPREFRAYPTLRKPFTPAQLYEAIEACVGGESAASAAEQP